MPGIQCPDCGRPTPNCICNGGLDDTWAFPWEKEFWKLWGVALSEGWGTFLGGGVQGEQIEQEIADQIGVPIPDTFYPDGGVVNPEDPTRSPGSPLIQLGMIALGCYIGYQTLKYVSRRI